MIVFPKAKINLGLRIIRRRDDGFHDIETVFYPVGLFDALEFAVAESGSGKDIITVTGDINTGLPENNLVLKAIQKLRTLRDLPYLKIHLHKAIPAGAGLGGGSSDASFMMKAANKFFNLKINNDILMSAALELGSDCPFFIESLPALATGKGDILTHIQPVTGNYYLVIVNPGVGINTREAYQNCKPFVPSTSLADIYKSPVSDWKKLMLNDFEEYAFSVHPVIRELKDSLYKNGAIFSLMSGSGSSVFGIFPEKPDLNTTIKSHLIWEGQL